MCSARKDYNIISKICKICYNLGNGDKMTKISLSDVQMQLCTIQDLATICNIQKIMYDNLAEDEKDFYFTDSDELIAGILANPSQFGWIYGAMYEGQMIGYIYLSIAPKAKELVNLLAMDIQNYADLDGVIVLPEYRGNGLQKYMFDFIEEEARKKGIFHLVAEITCNNHYSLDNALAKGFTIKKTFKKFGLTERFLVYKDIS